VEAKDTELTQKQIDKIDEQGVVDGDIVPYLKAQAEIFFKAGGRALAGELIAELNKLTKWGLEWEWMSPQDDGEYVEYQAIFDLLKAQLKIWSKNNPDLL